MRYFFLFALTVAVLADVSASSADGSEDEDLKPHYQALSKIVSTSSEGLGSTRLTEIGAHLALGNPMETIMATVTKMNQDIRAERSVAQTKETADRNMCTTTIAGYNSKINQHNKAAAAATATAGAEYALWNAKIKIPDELNKTRAERNASIATQEVKAARGQAQRDSERAEFLKLQSAFEYALSNISLIGRVLNGEGTLGDLGGFLEQSPCSARFAQIAEETKHVPRVSSMLQVFSKTFQKIEQTPVAKVGDASSTTAQAQKNSGDMDAINTILAKVRENLIASLAAAAEQENKLIGLWKASKQEQRAKINDDWITNWVNFEDQGSTEEYIGTHFQDEGKAKIEAAQNMKKGDEFRILLEFLHTRCTASRKAFVVTMNNYANEINALQKVIDYLQNNVLKKWSKNIVAVISSPYEWNLESAPTYLDVKNTWSTTAFNDDPVSCRTPYATVFTKIRVVSQVQTNVKFIDPNDLTFSSNMDVARKSPASNIQCQLFPSGLPLGRANSCSELEFATASLDLTGTGYKFGTPAKAMFKIFGRKTDGSEATFTNGDQTLTIKVRGRCGDLYGDDASPELADYRSDPIPLETFGALASGK